jgi:hypothetical protein
MRLRETVLPTMAGEYCPCHLLVSLGVLAVRGLRALLGVAWGASRAALGGRGPSSSPASDGKGGCRCP